MFIKVEYLFELDRKLCKRKISILYINCKFLHLTLGSMKAIKKEKEGQIFMIN